MLSRGWNVRIGLAVATAALGASVLAGPAWGSVSPTPANGTPQLAKAGRTEQVRKMLPCNGTMYAVGRFSSISWGGTPTPGTTSFRFRATAPFTVSSWDPDVNGTVNSIAFNNTCSLAYLGGDFTTVHGTRATNLVEVSTSTGAVVTSFGHHANGQVETLLKTHEHLLTGGNFTRINGSGRRYMTSLNPGTGRDDGFLRLNISGNYHYCFGGQCAGRNPTRVYNQQLSHSKSYDLVEGDFTSVGGQARQQIFMLNLTGSAGGSRRGPRPSSTSTAASPSRSTCGPRPGRRTIQRSTPRPPASTSTTGTVRSRYRLCDTAAAFPAAHRSVTHRWLNYTGCDSLYSTAADASTAYVGGHERWSQNPGAVTRQGLGRLAPPAWKGCPPARRLLFNPTRARGTAPMACSSPAPGAVDLQRQLRGLHLMRRRGWSRRDLLPAQLTGGLVRPGCLQRPGQRV